MKAVIRLFQKDPLLVVFVLVLNSASTLMLHTLVPELFPNYFFFVAFGLLFFLVFANIEFVVWTAFSRYLYIFSIIFLLLPLIIGQVTRGAIRWIPLGNLTIQPSEIVRPFLLMFFAWYLTAQDLDARRLLKAFVLFAFPTFLIIIQPSLGVAILTTVGFIGVLISTTINKKYLAAGLAASILLLPLVWNIMAPYQKLRVTSFVDPYSDPAGAGYNSIQSMISVGSGRLFGKGLGEGAQTQLAFLPERHTDFIFASISEELGLIGAVIIIVMLFAVLWRVVRILEQSINYTARAYVSGVFLVLLVQVVVHAGMNMGLFPITGLPLPLVSAGGSSLIATMMSLGIVLGVKRKTA